AGSRGCSSCGVGGREPHRPGGLDRGVRGLRPYGGGGWVYALTSLYHVYNELASKPEPLLRCFADAFSNLGVPNVKGFNQVLVVLAGEHTEVVRESGWARRDVQRFLIEHTRRRVADLKRAARLPGDVLPHDETTWRSLLH